ncbi:MAG: hypothetical protein JXA11_08360 [Phycisphaerae bacterium]|nr:hypothetical protein [Phycisphaerae bacterium]
MDIAEVTDVQIVEFLTRRAERLLGATRSLSEDGAQFLYTRCLMGELLGESTKMQEILDAYGARNNGQWYRFRALVGVLKRFSNVGYILLHIHHVLPSYHLLPIEEDFIEATESAQAFVGGILLRASNRLLQEADLLGIPIPDGAFVEEAIPEEDPQGQLPHDRPSRRIETVAETVTHLSTAFLNLASECSMVHVARRAKPEDYPKYIPSPVSEQTLLDLQFKFHALQAMYDTYVQETETEGMDGDLPILRGHISVVFHLLETACEFAHYYERHVLNIGRERYEDAPVEEDSLLRMLMEYSIKFASLYITQAKDLCQSMLKRYAEIGEIHVPVPRYRGFHVRPSTLVAKIVLHYGSEVRMMIDSDMYDASMPMDIFRANEKINAWKRKWLSSKIGHLPVRNGTQAGDVPLNTILRRLVIQMAEQGLLVIYEQPLELYDEPIHPGGTLLEQVTAELARLQATGKVDIQAQMDVTFIGDTRVLSDIQLLAENGYGEDHFGNNIALPTELAYARR